MATLQSAAQEKNGQLFGQTSLSSKFWWGRWKQLDDLLHLHDIAQIQPYIHAAGRLQYAKSSPIYLPTMEDIEEKVP